MRPIEDVSRRAASVTIIADDLSGAADSAVACAERGLETVVTLSDASNAEEADAVALDADTRRQSADAAAAEIARVVRARAGGAGMLFKKIDSTLRGHVGAEVAALIAERRRMISAAAPRPVAVVAPAFPAQGRTTIGGCQRLDGVPLEATELWRRERMTGGASVLEMIRAAGVTGALVPIETVRRGEDAVGAAIAGLVDRADALVCDAETDDDLAAVARASLTIGRDCVWVGSAGLVGHLIDAAGLTRARNGVLRVPAVAGPLMFVVGSLSPVSRRQADRLAAEDVAVVAIDGPTRAGWADAADRLRGAIAAGRDVLILSTPQVAPSREEAAAQSAALAGVVTPHAAHIGGLFVTGGETARAVLTSMRVTSLRLVAEIEQGVPLSVAVAPRPFPIITKAGAFGGAATMVNCRRALREWSSVPAARAAAREAQA